QTSYPSWGYMIREGATTLWERWELLKGGAMNSHNHHMFGTVDIYFYRYLAGVRPLKPGFREFAVKPDPVGPERVSASVGALTGSIQIELSRSRGVNVLKVHVPVGSTALIYVPTHGLRKPVVLESGRVVWRGGEPLELTEGVERAWAEGEYAVFEVGSGTYVFEARSTELQA
ncbi:MAG: alpha-L-rhamnosidase C-terminal domain-containing protein, partial [Thermofilaceae archaeon]